MGGWEKEAVQKTSRRIPLPKTGFGPHFVWYVFHPHTFCQGQILTVWILAAKLPNSDLDFAVDFFLLFFFARKTARKNPSKNPPQNSPGKSVGKFLSDFCRSAFLDVLYPPPYHCHHKHYRPEKILSELFPEFLTGSLPESIPSESI